MSEQKTLTADQLIVLSGLNKSPSEVIALQQPGPIKRLRRWLDDGVKRYAYMRLKNLVLDGDLFSSKLIVYVGLGSLVLYLAYIALPIRLFIGLSVLGAFFYTLFVVERNREIKNDSMSLLSHAAFYVRNLVLSPFDIVLIQWLGGATRWDDDDQDRRIWITDDRVHRLLIFGREAEEENAQNTISHLRGYYLDGLKRVEAELIGPDSDWSRSLIDLRARLVKIEQFKMRTVARIKIVKEANDDESFEALESTRVRLISTERSLNAAIQSISSLIENTQTELSKLHVFIDKIGEVYQDAELIREAEASMDASEETIDYAHQLQAQAHEKISRQLMAVASVVIGHKLLPNPKIEAIDMPRYLDEIEHAASAIVKIGEA